MRFVLICSIAVLAGTPALGDRRHDPYVGVPIFDRAPAAGTLKHDNLALVRNPELCGTSPWRYELLIGGNDKLGQKRVSGVCVNVVNDPTQKADAEQGRPSQAYAPQREAAPGTASPSDGYRSDRSTPQGPRRVLNEEPGRGQLGAGETVFVRFSDKHRCGPGQLVRVVGASGQSGRRDRSCVPG